MPYCSKLSTLRTGVEILLRTTGNPPTEEKKNKAATNDVRLTVESFMYIAGMHPPFSLLTETDEIRLGSNSFAQNIVPKHR